MTTPNPETHTSELQLSENKEYWNIVFHSIVSFLGQSLMQMVDLLFCKPLGSKASATVGTATSLFAWFLIIGLGLISSLEYFIPNSIGEKNEKKAHAFFYTGLIVAGLISLISIFGITGLATLTPNLGINPEIIPDVKIFCYLIALSYIPVFYIQVLRVELQARGYPHDATAAFIFGNILNIFLNWSLVLGHAGFPAMGIRGSALANLISRFGILAYVAIRVYQVRKKITHPLHANELQLKTHTLEILKMGTPTSLHMLFEMGAFVFVSTLAARLSANQNAAHTIAISIASFAFMIPMGISSAAALTMSKANGEKKPKKAILLGNRSLKLGCFTALLGSLFFIFQREWIASLYTSDPETLKIGTHILFIVAIFQFGDAMQAILASCLRGFGKTKIQAIVNAFGHWVIGIPLGVYLCFYSHLEIIGLWIGLCTGLFTVAAGLYWKWHELKKEFSFSLFTPGDV